MPIKTIEETADFYHSMYLEPDDFYWKHAFLTCLDLLERIQNLEENSLLEEHLKECVDCEMEDN